MSRLRDVAAHRFHVATVRTSALPPRRIGNVRIVAKTLGRHLRQSGYDGKAVLALATELLGLVAQSVADGTATSSARSGDNEPSALDGPAIATSAELP